ncbi:hypothetical protein SAMN04488066_105196 [Halorubrum aquaticum]|uniref:Uncharacterized protein n=1 Tax=Halorubrum aquaticum TaxID=387340 RepID=A0A1I3AG62_9EURY|nr:DUF5817 domain-containing protein [Halorubrum aquaticum]SFH49032.1 hypothetical protein SAMN04488066_105196 [Halorubrum aquaticum]
MYAVVGCNRCGNLWLVRDPRSSETARCSRCETTHRTAKLKRLFESDDREAAREARAALLAEKRGDGEAFADVGHVSELERAVEDAGIDDREYLEASGLDADAVFDAGSRAEGSAGSTRSREEVVRDGVDEAAEPTEERIVAYATDHGVPAEAARDLLEKLTRRGELSESQGRYRTL